MMSMFETRWETRISARGHPYRVLARPMPWIDDNILECVVYLYPSEADAEDGVRLGGSGFLIGFELNEKARLLMLVTNKHVVDAGSYVARINTRAGGVDVIALDNAEWFFHPDGDDIAVCPIQGLGIAHKCSYLGENVFLTKPKLEALNIGIGDEVIIAGRFISHEGKQKNLPSVRFGCIAQMPWEPLVVGGYPQESFLVEARSIGGYSGSPVFVYLPPTPDLPRVPGVDVDLGRSFPMLNPKRRGLHWPLGPFLLGIDFCHLYSDEPVRDKETGTPMYGWQVRSNTGMMGVIPTWRLIDVIKSEKMKPVLARAKQEAAKIAAADSPVSLDAANAAPPTSDANPNHREDFMRLLGEAARKPGRED